MKNQQTKKSFFRRNAVYFVLAFCILAIGATVTFMLVRNANDFELNAPPIVEDPSGDVNTPIDPEPNEPVDKPNEPVDTQPTQPVVEPVSFIMPVSSATSITQYSDTMVFNSTLNRFTAHMAIDFFAPEGAEVLAVYGGKVKSVETTLLKGVTITIDHGDGLLTVYNSLADDSMVKVGQTVEKGQVIGQVSTSNRQEYKAGAHLHFEVMEDGKTIDPAKYLVFEEK